MINVETLTQKELAGVIDHTQLKAYASSEDLKKLCDEARQYEFAMVAVNSVQTAFCKKLLSDTKVHVGSTISFPLGQTSIETKIFETANAIENGADEIDYVINITELKGGNHDYIKREMDEIVSLCRKCKVISKVIFENCYLEKSEIETVSKIALQVGPDFIKTSTGFGTGGATVEDVKLMKQIVGDDVKVKAAGGIRSWETCREMLLAGAERIGTSSGIKIISEFNESK
jgi:deoxyribose-phosphate aldolase